MTHYIGLDAHSKTCTAVVTDGLGKITKRAQFATSEKNLTEFIKTVPRPRSLAFEEMNLAHWLFVLTKDHVDDLAVAHAPYLMKQRGPKTDFIDAVRLATELRCGTISRVYHEDSKLWDLRALVNSYQDFTVDLSRKKIRYKSFLRSLGVFTEGDSPYTERALIPTLKKDHHIFVATNMFDSIQAEQKLKDSFEERFKKLSKQWPGIAKLRTIPGISYIRASIIFALVCAPTRFANKHKFWSYCGLVRHMEESDGKIYGIKQVHARSELKAVFMGAATAVLMGTSELRRYYDRLRSKGASDQEAKKAVARRIAATALSILKNGGKYDDLFEEKRRRLEKQAMN